MTFEASKKSNLKAQIVRVNNDFNPDSFDALYRTIKRIMSGVLFPEIESWLLDLLKNEKLYVINGILAVLHSDFENYQEAQAFATIARQDFPDTDIWDIIITSALQAREEEERPENLFE